MSRLALIRRHLEEPRGAHPAHIWMPRQALIRRHLEEPRGAHPAHIWIPSAASSRTSSPNQKRSAT
jgi:hypothetical protein